MESKERRLNSMNIIVLNNLITSRLTSDQGQPLRDHSTQVYGDFGIFASSFADINPEQPTTIHLIGKHAMVISHFTTDLYNTLLHIYKTYQNITENVTIKVDSKHMQENLAREFDNVILSNQEKG